MNRYDKAPIIRLGRQYGTSYIIPKLREKVRNGEIRYNLIQLSGNERLDSLAGQYYGNSELYWVIAAASDIGWCLQIPAGTIIKIPLFEDIQQIISS